MKIIDAIVKFDIGFNQYLIDKCINFVEKFGKPMRVGVDETARLDNNIRKVDGIGLFNQPRETPEDICKYTMFNFISREISKYIIMYYSKFPYHNTTTVNQIDILKYSEHGKYEVHVDSSTRTNRTISVIMNLNDNYEGGDFIFFNPIKRNEIIHREKLKKGSILFFPSNFLYPHSVEPITKGTRYSIVSWVA